MMHRHFSMLCWVARLIIWLIILAWLIFPFLCARAENVYPITWHWPTNATAAAVQAQYPWMRLAPERVNLDISLDGGSTWRSLARGVPSSYGDNIWSMRLPDSPEWLSAATRVGISSLPAYGRELRVQARDIAIVGIHMVDPPTVVTNGVSVTLRWVACGAGALVTLGTRAIGAEDWAAQAVFASTDSNQGATTNSAQWAVSGVQPGAIEIILQSLADPLCYRRHALIVEAAP